MRAQLAEPQQIGQLQQSQRLGEAGRLALHLEKARTALCWTKTAEARQKGRASVALHNVKWAPSGGGGGER